MNKDVVGKSPRRSARWPASTVPEGARIILLPAKGAGKDGYPGARRNYARSWRSCRTRHFEDAVAKAKANLLVEGAGHSAAVHSNNEAHIRSHGRRAADQPPGRQSGFARITAGGSLTNGFAPTTTLGCGSWGGNSISENLDYKHLMNVSPHRQGDHRQAGADRRGNLGDVDDEIVEGDGDDGRAGRTGPPQARPERTRRDILAAAREEFAEHGLSGARVDVIAARTNTVKRMIYYYFGSKEGLYLAVLEAAYADIRRFEGDLDLDRIPGRSHPPSDGLHVRLRRGASRLHPSGFNENMHHAEHVAQSASIQELNAGHRHAGTRVLDRGERDGVFRRTVDPLDVHL